MSPPAYNRHASEFSDNDPFITEYAQGIYQFLGVGNELEHDKKQAHNEQGCRWTKLPIHLGAFGLKNPSGVAG